MILGLVSQIMTVEVDDVRNTGARGVLAAGPSRFA
jgi:hypothetical protein